MSRNEKKISPLFILPNLKGGGAEIVTLNLLSGMVKEGGQPKLYLFSKKFNDHTIPDNLMIDGNFIVPKLPFRENGKIVSFLKFIGNVKKSTVLIGALEIKTHSLAVLLGILFRRPVVLWLHKDLRVFLENKSGFGRIIYKLIFLLNLSFSKKIVTVSRGVRDGLVDIFPKFKEKMECIYNPLDFSSIEMERRDSYAEPWLTDKFILAVGRLTWQKGFDVLLDAFLIISKCFPSLKLVILGEGDLRDDLLRKVKDLELSEKVYLPGFAKPYLAMSQAELVTISSRFEGLSMVLIEALYCGARIVSTDCPAGPAEVLAFGKYGTLVQVDAPAEMAEAMAAVLSKADDQKFQEKRKMRAMDFSIEKIVPEWKKLFMEVASK